MTIPEQHRHLAAATFNETWDLLDKTDRTPAEDERMVHAAHASRYHWEQVGDESNLAVGEWQLARVYATLGRFEPGWHHAQRGLALCVDRGLSPFLTGEAHEAAARLAALQGDRPRAEQHLASARELLVLVADDEERAVLAGDLEAVAGLL
ncbi:MAG: hypothetical protein HZB16_08770 [Armatimonadetes bacterium]|nr:hypothetical protein [Armatimonadota bacterium]